MNRWRGPRPKANRKELRANQTEAERLLWYRLGSRQLGGAKFRRQHPIGPYIVDFYCPAERLAVELDGEGHAAPAQMERDRERTAYLEAFGIRVLRFANLDVIQRTDSVLEAIMGTLTLPSPASAGEGE